MNWWNALLSNTGGGIVSEVGKIVDSLHTSDEEEMQAEIEFRRLDIEEQEINSRLLTGQMEVNKEEAKSGNIFIAGWRPAIGWISAIAIGYEFLFRPLLLWAWVILQSNGTIPLAVDPPPQVDSAPLFALVTAMLGISASRSWDKLKGTDTQKIK